MKIKLYDEPAPTEEKEITLRLTRGYENGPVVVVAAVDGTGKTIDCGRLIEFNNDMTFTRPSCVNSKLGLPLNANQQLTEDTDD